MLFDVVQLFLPLFFQFGLFDIELALVLYLLSPLLQLIIIQLNIILPLLFLLLLQLMLPGDGAHDAKDRSAGIE